MQAMEEELKMLRSGVAVLLHDTTPVPGANAQLRCFCADLGRLLVASVNASAQVPQVLLNLCLPALGSNLMTLLSAIGSLPRGPVFRAGSVVRDLDRVSALLLLSSHWFRSPRRLCFSV